jgi:hypothetical protein
VAGFRLDFPQSVVPGSDGLLSPASAPNSPVHFCSGDVSEYIIIIIIFIHQIPIQAHMKLHTIIDTKRIYIIAIKHKIIKSALTFLYYE